MLFIAMLAELPWQQRIAYSKLILNPMKSNFNMERDIPLLKKCTKFQLILGKIAYFLVAMLTILKKTS